jgi:aquaporin Z
MNAALKAALIAMTAALVITDFTRAEIVEVTHLELRVPQLQRSVEFFTRVLHFRVEQRDRSSATLRLGEETLVLRSGASSPAKASNDRGFQHIAIVVTDVNAAYRQLMAHGVTVVSEGPQRLPGWNRDVAGIAALYFRDPDGTSLELIQFPPDKGEPRWHRRGAPLFAGIDHTAVVVESTARALAFYRDQVGLRIAGESFNHGREQELLSAVPGARVRVTALRGARGPGVELLEYEQPGLLRASRFAGAPPWIIHLAAGASNRFCASAALGDPDGHPLRCGGPPARWHVQAVDALRRHGVRYAMEGAELGVFLAVALYLTILLEHPRSRLHRRIRVAWVRRAVLGVGIAATVICLVYSRWGMQSGAHFNPSVTLSMLALHRIQPWDALWYMAAQLAGGFFGLWLAALPCRRAAEHPSVRYVATEPGPAGERAALAAEFVISFWMMLTLRLVYQSDSLKDWIGWVAGANLFLFIVFEAPLSGMSLNPARTVASSLAARSWKSVWVYFVAPTCAMHIAAAWAEH